MISIALILGAPETVPAGKVALNKSMADKPSSNSASTLETICIT